MNESVELDIQRERVAKNQSLFREVNERIGELAGSAMFASFICECADETCDEPVSLTHEAYEWIRSESNRFLVVKGHEICAVEEVVRATDKYLVVAKLGRGETVAEHLDPRKRATR